MNSEILKESSKYYIVNTYGNKKYLTKNMKDLLSYISNLEDKSYIIKKDGDYKHIKIGDTNYIKKVIPIDIKQFMLKKDAYFRVNNLHDYKDLLTELDKMGCKTWDMDPANRELDDFIRTKSAFYTFQKHRANTVVHTYIHDGKLYMEVFPKDIVVFDFNNCFLYGELYFNSKDFLTSNIQYTDGAPHIDFAFPTNSPC